MTRIVRLKIDVTKIDKERLFAGKKGTYLDATVFLNDEAGQYGDNGMITQDVSKEEREAGTKGAILGNATIFKVMDDDRFEAASESVSNEPLPF
jgi:Ser-tRNA(Ala) deacylase AlaX